MIEDTCCIWLYPELHEESNGVRNLRKKFNLKRNNMHKIESTKRGETNIGKF